jgi:hypothetical protein
MSLCGVAFNAGGLVAKEFVLRVLVSADGLIRVRTLHFGEEWTLWMVALCVVIWSQCWDSRNPSGIRGFRQRAQLSYRRLSFGRRIGRSRWFFGTTGDAAL